MKFWLYTVIITGLLVFLNLGGLSSPATTTMLSALSINIDNTATTFNVTMGSVMDSTLFGNSSSNGLPIGLKYLLTAMAISGIIIGFFGKSPDVSWAIGLLVFTVVSILVSDMLYIVGLIISNGETWMVGVGLAIFAPIIAGFYISAISFWRGTD